VRRALACGVTALALFAGDLTRTASADPTPPAPDPSSDAVTQTPLQVRPSKPLVLEPSPPASNVGWKLFAMVSIAGAGFWLWKRRAARPVTFQVPQLAILRRISLGVRSELVLIELDGQRLLLGVTPHTVQNLYIVPDASAEETTDDGEDRETATYGRRLAGMIGAVEEARTEGSAAPASPVQPKRSKRTGRAVAEPIAMPVEGQARGLAALGERK
jgi:flagellar biogenesis protein FliO